MVPSCDLLGMDSSTSIFVSESLEYGNILHSVISSVSKPWYGITQICEPENGILLPNRLGLFALLNSSEQLVPTVLVYELGESPFARSELLFIFALALGYGCKHVVLVTRDNVQVDSMETITLLFNEIVMYQTRVVAMQVHIAPYDLSYFIRLLRLEMGVPVEPCAVYEQFQAFQTGLDCDFSIHLPTLNYCFAHRHLLSVVANYALDSSVLEKLDAFDSDVLDTFFLDTFRAIVESEPHARPRPAGVYIDVFLPYETKGFRNTQRSLDIEPSIAVHSCKRVTTMPNATLNTDFPHFTRCISDVLVEDVDIKENWLACAQESRLFIQTEIQVNGSATVRFSTLNGNHVLWFRDYQNLKDWISSVIESSETTTHCLLGKSERLFVMNRCAPMDFNFDSCTLVEYVRSLAYLTNSVVGAVEVVTK